MTLMYFTTWSGVLTGIGFGFLALCVWYIALRWGSYAIFKSWVQVLREARDARRKTSNEE